MSSEAGQSLYELLGGREQVLLLSEAFYDAMEELEPALAALHTVDDQGHVSRENRDRFGLFLIGWLGGPQEYMERHGHPRLRMRHARVPVDARMRDAWVHSMSAALDRRGVEGDIRAFLEHRFAEIADFLRNVAEPASEG